MDFANTHALILRELIPAHAIVASSLVPTTGNAKMLMNVPRIIIPAETTETDISV